MKWQANNTASKFVIRIFPKDKILFSSKATVRKVKLGHIPAMGPIFGDLIVTDKHIFFLAGKRHLFFAYFKYLLLIFVVLNINFLIFNLEPTNIIARMLYPLDPLNVTILILLVVAILLASLLETRLIWERACFKSIDPRSKTLTLSGQFKLRWGMVKGVALINIEKHFWKLAKLLQG